ncbi:hypothetical protein CAPTEDRAFT_222035 [Capitella teleta]|uniref:Nitrogen permease regulator 2-like protein n=1 Tax=Capitella teleta TaxID=283909 RepID=R7TWM3_CAPTE|nr:hypothetical protein CAPTEDRAFT_222035 [Capitella teleta]|eukprot:ELT95816.1 hypothetical protein CAPTEDRAFT_222035 [Capitella teleta]
MKTNEEIRCIFFSEFHPTAGPKLVYQVPADYLSKEEFDNIQVYIITKPKLTDKIITLNALGKKIIGCPICIEGRQYVRNALIFNLCLVVDDCVSAVKYENVIRKLAAYFTTLEVNFKFATQNSFLSNEETKPRISSVLEKIRDELNGIGTCCIPINDSTTINLQITPESSDPCPVKDHDVPILKPNCSLNVDWDLSTQQLMSSIDGFRHVLRIAVEADVDINFIKLGIENLIHLGLVQLITIFQYSNVYVTTPKISSLAENSASREECLRYVSKQDANPCFRDIFLLYCGLTAGTTVRDLCARYHPHSLGIDVRKLIQYGSMQGYIRRLHKYPVKLPNEGGSSFLRHLYRWFSGAHSYDEICTATGLSHQELDEKLDCDPSIVICWK